MNNACPMHVRRVSGRDGELCVYIVHISEECVNLLGLGFLAFPENIAFLSYASTTPSAVRRPVSNFRARGCVCVG